MTKTIEQILEKENLGSPNFVTGDDDSMIRRLEQDKYNGRTTNGW